MEVKRGSLNLWKQGRSRSRSSADCPVHLVLAAAFIAQHHALGALLFLRRSCRMSLRVACPSAWCAHMSPRATCPGRGLASSALSLRPHVAARCRILDCTPDRSAASLQPWPRLLGVLHPIHVAALCRVPDCPPARSIEVRGLIHNCSLNVSPLLHVCS